MFKTNRQEKLSLFDFPLGELDADNRWVVLEQFVPWNAIDDIYSLKFEGDKGRPAYPSRMAFGALLIQQNLRCSDRELVAQVAENPYLQYFLGLDRFQLQSPFAASTLVDFRKRFTAEDLSAVNDAIEKMKAALYADAHDDGDGQEDDQTGTLIMDATVTPASIRYPQDTSLLMEVRENLEAMIDALCAQTGTKHPRTYRLKAKREAQSFSKKRRKSAREVRKCIRSQLGYIQRDLKHIKALLKAGGELGGKASTRLATCYRVYGQQLTMYKEKTHRVPDRIVSLSQPWVRPIVRGKAKAPVEFGAKLHAVIEDGLMRQDVLSFDAFNESERLIVAAESYRERHGVWPKAILADKIYQTRKNRAFCKERSIRLTGPKLGRPAKEREARAEESRQLKKDTSKRNLIEASFGTVKGSFGLDRLSVKLAKTTQAVVGMAIVAFNLKKLARLSYALILLLFNRLHFPVLWHGFNGIPQFCEFLN